MMTKLGTHQERRHAFTLKLANAIRHNCDIIYCDESAFNSFIYQRRTWSYQGEAVNIPINQFRYSVTALGSIGACIKGNFCMTWSESSCADSFLDHLKTLKRSLRNPALKPLLVLDNARWHIAESVTDYLDKNFRPLWMPSYSPAFNSIEWGWALAKTRLRQALLENQLRNLSREEFLALVK